MLWQPASGSAPDEGSSVTRKTLLIFPIVTLGWTPLMAAEGVFAGATGKRAPQSEATLRELMIQHSLDPAPFSQASFTTQSSAR